MEPKEKIGVMTGNRTQYGKGNDEIEAKDKVGGKKI